MSSNQSFQQWQTLCKHGEAQEAAIGKLKMMKMAGRRLLNSKRSKQVRKVASLESGVEAATAEASPIAVSPLVGTKEPLAFWMV